MISYTDELLIGICKKLQLQQNKYQLADDRYHTIADIIQGDPVFENIDLKMYPQGSFRLKTTVKPLAENEYDLDFVVELPNDIQMSPNVLYNHIYRILKGDGIHNDKVEKKSRCIRINYANDFHMDIMPGQRINDWSNEIIVPDRQLRGWYHHSNPIDYADWFEKQAKSRIVAALKNSLNEQAEPITNQEIVSKLEPLRRSVQLVKRYRDIYCDSTGAEPVRSIVICTLMGEICSSYANEIEILNDFCLYVKSLINLNKGRPFKVNNPVVNEVLTEKWEEDIQNYLDFVDMMDALTDDLNRLSSLVKGTEIGTLMKKMFGETVTTEVIKEHAEMISKARSSGKLTMKNDGGLQVVNEGVIVKPNTFYGD